MDLAEFKRSLSGESLPEGIEGALRALWLDGKGNWKGAHETVQADSAGAGAWVHAYLHRKEGDEGNARYWYSRASRPFCELSLTEEWDEIASALLAEGW